MPSILLASYPEMTGVLAPLNKRSFSGYIQNGARFGVNKRRFSGYAKKNGLFLNFSS
jgi:hypothetical protein